MGQGPVTGRGMGSCTGQDLHRRDNRPPGRGLAMRQGRGRGRRGRCGGWDYDCISAPPDTKQEETSIRSTPVRLLEQLENVEKRLTELESKS